MPDVARTLGEFPNPITGEILTLSSPDVDLARFVVDVRDYESQIREAKRIVQRELISRRDRERKWTIHLPGGLKLSTPRPTPTEEWDGLELRNALLPFVEDDELPIEAVDKAVRVTVAYDVRKIGVKALRDGGGAVARVVNELARTVEKDRSVTVGRS